MAALRARQDCPVNFLHYVCANGWQGCCSVDPCNPGDTCAVENQVPPRRTDNPRASTRTRKSTTPAPTSSTSDATIATTPSEATPTTAETSPSSSSTTLVEPTSTVSTPPPTTTATPEPDAATHGSNKGVIAGSVVAGAVGIIVFIILASLLLIRRRKRANAIHHATLERRESMRPMESDDKQGVFAPFGGFYRGIKTVHQPVETHPSEASEHEIADTPTPSRHSYRVVNADPSPMSSPTSQAELSGVPLVKEEPVRIPSSQETTAPVEMPDTSPTSAAFEQRSRIQSGSSTLAISPQTVYQPYRPASEAASMVSSVASQVHQTDARVVSPRP